MPGIACVVDRKKGNDFFGTALNRMQTALHSEAFYRKGRYSNNKMGIGITWTEWSGSQSYAEPFANSARNILLFMVGEVFQCGLEGDSAQRQAGPVDPRQIIQAYESQGSKCIEDLNGAYCGIIVDTRNESTVAFSDRYGMYRFFHYEDSELTIVSTEAKAILRLIPRTREYDPKGLSQYIACGCTFGSNSIFRHIAVLPPASRVLISGRDIKKQEKYVAADVRKKGAQRSTEKCKAEIVEASATIINRYVGKQERIGISLTGGLDSRMIVACLQHEGQRCVCYTFGSQYRDSLDVITARRVAAACRLKYATIVLGQEFLKSFDSLHEKAIAIAEGYIGLDGASELYLNACARSHSAVRITGNYGGELLRRQRSFKFESPDSSLVLPELGPYFKEGEEEFNEELRADFLSFALGIQVGSQSFGRRAVEQSQLTIRTPFLDNDLIALLSSAPANMFENDSLSFEIIKHGNPRLASIPTDRGAVFGRRGLQPLAVRLLRRSMIKAEYLAGHGMPRWLPGIAKKLIDRYSERRIYGINKFQHYSLWIRRELREYFMDTMHSTRDSRLNEFFNMDEARRMCAEHMMGKRNNIKEIDLISTLLVAEKALLGS